jgi:hypothetical protein
MILNGNQLGGARDLALHLTKPENEHFEIHEIRGFVADTLFGALKEAEAISRGTRCRQFLYSLSLNPPETENVPVAAFEDAIERVEKKLGLTGHARVVVFHEKQGRRHAHCVWSRIDTERMRAVRMSHDRLKLGDISRELYFEHGWKMPEGLIDPALRNPLNFDRQEWFKAKRAGKDPRATSRPRSASAGPRRTPARRSGRHWNSAAIISRAATDDLSSPWTSRARSMPSPAGWT